MEELPDILKQYKQKIKEDQSLKVPENYFDQMTSDIMTRIDDEAFAQKPSPTEEPKQSVWNYFSIARLGLGLSVLLLLIIGVNYFSPTEQEMTLAHIETDSIEEFILDELESEDSELLDNIYAFQVNEYTEDEEFLDEILDQSDIDLEDLF